MPPDDPLGRNGPTLDNFLRKTPGPPENKRLHCPYGTPPNGFPFSSRLLESQMFPHSCSWSPICDLSRCPTGFTSFSPLVHFVCIAFGVGVLLIATAPTNGLKDCPNGSLPVLSEGTEPCSARISLKTQFHSNYLSTRM